jgi:hypothetical protein
MNFERLQKTSFRQILGNQMSQGENGKVFITYVDFDGLQS